MRKSIIDRSFMCLMLFAYQVHSHYPLILLANRDEFYERPSQAAGFWSQYPELLAGRDLQAGGTWLGVSRAGKLAGITNYREPLVERAVSQQVNTPSRGKLPLDYLVGESSAKNFVQQLQANASQYAGFNLLLAQWESNTVGLYYYSNQSESQTAIPTALSAGIYGLSNHLLNSPWPKVVSGKQALAAIVSQYPDEYLPLEQLQTILQDRETVRDECLPDTGVGLELERLLAPRFIHSDYYGTRASTLITIDQHKQIQFWEKNFNAQGEMGQQRYCFSFN